MCTPTVKMWTDWLRVMDAILDNIVPEFRRRKALSRFIFKSSQVTFHPSRRLKSTWRRSKSESGQIAIWDGWLPGLVVGLTVTIKISISNTDDSGMKTKFGISTTLGIHQRKVGGVAVIFMMVLCAFKCLFLCSSFYIVNKWKITIFVSTYIVLQFYFAIAVVDGILQAEGGWECEITGHG